MGLEVGKQLATSYEIAHNVLSVNSSTWNSKSLIIGPTGVIAQSDELRSWRVSAAVPTAICRLRQTIPIAMSQRPVWRVENEMASAAESVRS